jgi:hypothetical protein
MERSYFTNNNYKYFLVVVIVFLISLNLYNLLVGGDLYALIGLAIQGVISALIMMRSKYLKPAIKIWSVVTLVGVFLWFWGMTLNTLTGDFEREKWLTVWRHLLNLAIFITLFRGSNRYIEIKQDGTNDEPASEQVVAEE